MSDARSWLPELVTMEQHAHDFKAFLEAVYAIFSRDFLGSKPAFTGKRFAVKRHPLSEGKEATFWHLVSEADSNGTEGGRTIDLRRCERIAWPKPIIEAAKTENVR